MPRSEKVKVNLRERVDDNACDLSLSGLNEIPVREISSYKRVTVLDLSSNCLTTLGKNFTILTRLVKIDLSKNQIKYLPDDFGLLRNLRHLDLYDNKLEHLPLSFGNLTNLRYLDLKGNPLTPALAKIVGFCLTTKECQDSARNTVKFLQRMQTEAERAKDQLKLESLSNAIGPTDELLSHSSSIADKSPTDNQKTKKSSNKKTKSKNKKANVQNNECSQEIYTTPTNRNNKVGKSKKSNNGVLKRSVTKSSTALATIFTFFLLLAINVLIIYIIMFKNPEIADKLVEFIPHQYRVWILTKTEIFRLRVTDWISEFRTPPQEY